MKFVWAAGTPLGPHVDLNGNPVPAVEVFIFGTLAAGAFQRGGQALATALEKELGYGAGTISLANVTTTSADVVAGGQTIGTLSDGIPDAPINNDIARHFRYLMQAWREHDAQTGTALVLLMVTRFMRAKWPGLTKTQYQAITGQTWDAASNATVDGD